MTTCDRQRSSVTHGGHRQLDTPGASTLWGGWGDVLLLCSVISLDCLAKSPFYYYYYYY